MERNVETKKRRQQKGESGHQSVNPRPGDPFFLTGKKNKALAEIFLACFIKITGKD
jgi:hypothetical protein